ncbi:MAG: SLC13 family permease, partial [FCB group bacterium]|nr:SLC13 family permease [FCB group bacterium]
MIITFDIIILLLVITAAIIMFAIEYVPMEVTALAAMGALMLFGLITPDQAISGFSNKAVITIGAMFILSRSLTMTGFLEVFADKVYKTVGGRKWPTITLFLLIVSIISGFINNTAAVAIFIPLAMNLCQKFHISPTKILIPLSYAAIFGGTLTLIGTSTNLVVSAVMEDEGLAPFRMFEFVRLGLIFLGVGMVYNLILARWVLPSRSILSSLARKYKLGRYLTEYKIGPESKLIGQTISNVDISKKYDLQVYMIIRDNVRYRFNLRTMQLKQGDIFLLHINVDQILPFKDEMNMLLLSDVKMTQQELTGKNHVIVEAIVSHGSSLIGKTLQEFDFRERFSSFVLAIRRHREDLLQKIAHIRLKFSDTLLVMVPRDKLDNLRNSNDLIVMEELEIHLKYEKYWWLSILVIPIIMVLAALEIVPLVKGAVLGVVLLLL